MSGRVVVSQLQGTVRVAAGERTVRILCSTSKTVESDSYTMRNTSMDGYDGNGATWAVGSPSVTDATAVAYSDVVRRRCKSRTGSSIAHGNARKPETCGPLQFTYIAVIKQLFGFQHYVRQLVLLQSDVRSMAPRKLGTRHGYRELELERLIQLIDGSTIAKQAFYLYTEPCYNETQ